MEIPVYLFTGFLGAGKTTFIQDLLEGSDFNAGEKTLLLMCEDGQVKTEPEKFARPNVFIEHLTQESQLTTELLEEFAAKYMFERVIVEYNGMWMLPTLFKAMPEEWVVYQEVMFADSLTFPIYNMNMRQQTFDKMQTAELVVFNRFEREFDKMEYHKIVRVANRKAQILYEYGPDEVEADDIEDPLPYDLEEEELVIEDEWYAEWYRDIYENPNVYDGKKLKIKGRIAMNEDLPEGTFAFGRHIMTCCEEDIQFAGLACTYPGKVKFKTGDWVNIEAEIRVEEAELYGEEGPVLHCKQVTATEPCNPELATF